MRSRKSRGGRASAGRRCTEPDVGSACTRSRLFLATKTPLSICAYVLLPPFLIVVSGDGALLGTRPRVSCSHRTIHSEESRKATVHWAHIQQLSVGACLMPIALVASKLRMPQLRREIRLSSLEIQKEAFIMPILYSVVARGTTILAKYAACSGNFDEVTENILVKIPAQNDKLTYSQGQYRFHYICEDNIIYMCVTDDDFQTSRAFLYLAEIKRRFLAAYGQDAQTAVPYAMNTDFARALGSTMKHYSESNQEIDALASVMGNLDELKDIMSKNIDNVAMRGERLELLVNKTENLTVNSVTFRKTSRNLARSLFWKNVKIYVFISIILIVVIYVIVCLSCGGLAWPKCVGN